MNVGLIDRSAREAQGLSRRGQTSPFGESTMTKRVLSCGALLVVLALPAMALAEPADGTIAPTAATKPTSGAATNVAERAGRTSHAAAKLELSSGEATKIRDYVTKEKTPSAKVAEQVTVGSILPTSVTLYPLPAHIGVKGDFRYSVVNDRIVLVEAKTHKVTEIIE
jgi:hypothetical protein